MKRDVKKQIGLSYDKYAEEFLSKYNKLDDVQIEKLDNFIKLLKGNKVLDVGCGGGKDSKYFEERGLDVYSIDISDKMIHATKNYIERGEVIYGDMENLPFRDECFDGIWCNASIVHVEDKQKTLNEFQRVLKKEGILYVCVHNLLSIWALKPILFSLTQGEMWPIKYREAFWYLTTKYHIKKYLQSLKFQILRENSLFEKWVWVYAEKI